MTTPASNPMTIDDARFIIENADEALANTYHMDFVEQYGDPEWDNRQAEMRRTINERVAEAEAVLAEANRRPTPADQRDICPKCGKAELRVAGVGELGWHIRCDYVLGRFLVCGWNEWLSDEAMIPQTPQKGPAK